MWSVAWWRQYTLYPDGDAGACHICIACLLTVHCSLFRWYAARILMLYFSGFILQTAIFIQVAKIYFHRTSAPHSAHRTHTHTISFFLYRLHIFRTIDSPGWHVKILRANKSPTATSINKITGRSAFAKWFNVQIKWRASVRESHLIKIVNCLDFCSNEP